MVCTESGISVCHGHTPSSVLGCHLYFSEGETQHRSRAPFQFLCLTAKPGRASLVRLDPRPAVSICSLSRPSLPGTLRDACYYLSVWALCAQQCGSLTHRSVNTLQELSALFCRCTQTHSSVTVCGRVEALGHFSCKGHSGCGPCDRCCWAAPECMSGKGSGALDLRAAV